MYNFRTFTASELDQMTEAILDILTKSKSEASLKLKESSICRKCGAENSVTKYGRDKNGKQRYRCKSCGTFFTDTSYSVISCTHYDVSKWKKYIECLLQGFSLQKCSTVCGISTRTAFLWRHKLLPLITKGAGRRLSHDEAVAYFADRVLNAESSSSDGMGNNITGESQTQSRYGNLLLKCDISDAQALKQFEDMYRAYISELSAFSERLRSEPVTKKEIKDIWNAENIEKLFIRYEGKFIGFLLLGILDNKHPESDWFIAEFFVQKEYRSLGFGTLAASELLASKGKYCLFVLEENEKAISFWNKAFQLCGYENVSEQYMTDCCPSDSLFYMYEPIKE